MAKYDKLYVVQDDEEHGQVCGIFTTPLLAISFIADSPFYFDLEDENRNIEKREKFVEEETKKLTDHINESLEPYWELKPFTFHVLTLTITIILTNKIAGVF